jgi:hypothetical protein
MNEKRMAIRKFFAAKRAGQELPFTYDELAALSPLVFPEELLPCPDATIGEGIAGAVWALLCIGYTPEEVKSSLRMTKHQYYKVIGSWKTDEVRKWLAG